MAVDKKKLKAMADYNKIVGKAENRASDALLYSETGRNVGGSTNFPVATNASRPVTTNKPQATMQPQIRQRMGNLDVQFDSSVPQSARRAFADAAPINNRPGANPTRADAQRQFQNRSMNAEFGGRRIPVSSSTSGLLTKENSDMGGKNRTLLNAKILESRIQAQANKAKLQEAYMNNQQSGINTRDTNQTRLTDREMANLQSGKETMATIKAKLKEREMINKQSGAEVESTNKNRLDVADLQAANLFNVSQGDNSSKEGIAQREIEEKRRQFNATRADNQVDNIMEYTGTGDTPERMQEAAQAVAVQNEMTGPVKPRERIAADSIMANLNLSPSQRIQYIMADPRLRLIYADEIKANRANR